MLYYLFDLLKDSDIPGSGLFQYLTFRAMAALVISMLIAFIAGKKIIRTLQRKQIGETIRDLGLEGQMQKKGTPTMGGIIIILALLVSVLLIGDLGNKYMQLLIFTTLWCGAIGFTDDYIKVFKHRKEGLSEKSKLLGQITLGFIIGLTVCFSSDIVVREKVSQTMVVEVSDSTAVAEGGPRTVELNTWKAEDVVKSTQTTIPFVKNHEFDYKSLSPFEGTWGWYAKWAIYVLMIIIVITACSNGANLTDGLDGLSAGTSAIVAVVIGILAYLSGNLLNSNYLNIMYIPASGEIAVFMAAFVGALIGFLWYNTFPAMVFMGDTGSLTIGGIIGVSAVLIRKELLLPLLCGIFLMESVSVLMQKYWFKYTRHKYGEGRRIFLMAPLHHHYQKKGIPEPRIVSRFWIIGIILGVATLALLKVR